ncbi:hypothetical protein MMPV_000970 [Pyropia vietnamensis]
MATTRAAVHVVAALVAAASLLPSRADAISPANLAALRADSQFTTEENLRANFDDPADFSVRIADITPTTTPQGTIVSGGLENLAVFGLSSVDSAFTRFTLQPGAHNLAHTHPTASETLFSISGTMDVFFVEANETPRLVESVLEAESVTVFPEGLIHGERCISDEPCEFISFFNTGDPGVVTVSERFCDLNPEARAAGLFLPQDQVNAICDGLGDNPAPNQPEQGERVLNDGPAEGVQVETPTPDPEVTPTPAEDEATPTPAPLSNNRPNNRRRGGPRRRNNRGRSRGSNFRRRRGGRN